jgi:hypothetical protein
MSGMEPVALPKACQTLKVWHRGPEAQSSALDALLSRSASAPRPTTTVAVGVDGAAPGDETPSATTTSIHRLMAGGATEPSASSSSTLRGAPGVVLSPLLIGCSAVVADEPLVRALASEGGHAAGRSESPRRRALRAGGAIARTVLVAEGTHSTPAGGDSLPCPRVGSLHIAVPLSREEFTMAAKALGQDMSGSNPLPLHVFLRRERLPDPTHPDASLAMERNTLRDIISLVAGETFVWGTPPLPSCGEALERTVLSHVSWPSPRETTDRARQRSQAYWVANKAIQRRAVLAKILDKTLHNEAICRRLGAEALDEEDDVTPRIEAVDPIHVEQNTERSESPGTPLPLPAPVSPTELFSERAATALVRAHQGRSPDDGVLLAVTETLTQVIDEQSALIREVTAKCQSFSQQADSILVGAETPATPSMTFSPLEAEAQVWSSIRAVASIDSMKETVRTLTSGALHACGVDETSSERARLVSTVHTVMHDAEAAHLANLALMIPQVLAVVRQAYAVDVERAKEFVSSMDRDAFQRILSLQSPSSGASASRSRAQSPRRVAVTALLSAARRRATTSLSYVFSNFRSALPDPVDTRGMIESQLSEELVGSFMDFAEAMARKAGVPDLTALEDGPSTPADPVSPIAPTTPGTSMDEKMQSARELAEVVLSREESGPDLASLVSKLVSLSSSSSGFTAIDQAERLLDITTTASIPALAKVLNLSPMSFEDEAVQSQVALWGLVASTCLSLCRDRASVVVFSRMTSQVAPWLKVAWALPGEVDMLAAWSLRRGLDTEVHTQELGMELVDTIGHAVTRFMHPTEASTPEQWALVVHALEHLVSSLETVSSDGRPHSDVAKLHGISGSIARVALEATRTLVPDPSFEHAGTMAEVLVDCVRRCTAEVERHASSPALSSSSASALGHMTELWLTWSVKFSLWSTPDADAPSLRSTWVSTIRPVLKPVLTHLSRLLMLHKWSVEVVTVVTQAVVRATLAGELLTELLSSATRSGALSRTQSARAEHNAELTPQMSRAKSLVVGHKPSPLSKDLDSLLVPVEEENGVEDDDDTDQQQPAPLHVLAGLALHTLSQCVERSALSQLIAAVEVKPGEFVGAANVATVVLCCGACSGVTPKTAAISASSTSGRRRGVTLSLEHASFAGCFLTPEEETSLRKALQASNAGRLLQQSAGLSRELFRQSAGTSQAISLASSGRTTGTLTRAGAVSASRLMTLRAVLDAYGRVLSETPSVDE